MLKCGPATSRSSPARTNAAAALQVSALLDVNAAFPHLLLALILHLHLYSMSKHQDVRGGQQHHPQPPGVPAGRGKGVRQASGSWPIAWKARQRASFRVEGPTSQVKPSVVSRALNSLLVLLGGNLGGKACVSGARTEAPVARKSPGPSGVNAGHVPPRRTV